MHLVDEGSLLCLEPVTLWTTSVKSCPETRQIISNPLREKGRNDTWRENMFPSWLRLNAFSQNVSVETARVMFFDSSHPKMQVFFSVLAFSFPSEVTKTQVFFRFKPENFPSEVTKTRVSFRFKPENLVCLFDSSNQKKAKFLFDSNTKSKNLLSLLKLATGIFCGWWKVFTR